MSNSWLVYVGVLFIAMVTFAPTGLTGIVLEHAPIARAGLLRRLVLPYLRILVPGLIMLIGFVGLVELLSFLTIGTAQGKRLALFGAGDRHLRRGAMADLAGLPAGRRLLVRPRISRRSSASGTA